MPDRILAALGYAFVLVFVTISLGVSVSFADNRVSGKTFALVERNVHFYDAVRFSNAPIKEQFEAALIAGLEARGMRRVETMESAELALSYIVVLENAASAEEVSSFRAAHPAIASLPNEPEKFEGGMVFAKLVDRESRIKVWDRTYKGLVALDMPEEPRKVRMDELIEYMMATLPQ